MPCRQDRHSVAGPPHELAPKTRPAQQKDNGHDDAGFDAGSAGHWSRIKSELHYYCCPHLLSKRRSREIQRDPYYTSSCKYKHKRSTSLGRRFNLCVSIVESPTCTVPPLTQLMRGRGRGRTEQPCLLATSGDPEPDVSQSTCWVSPEK